MIRVVVLSDGETWDTNWTEIEISQEELDEISYLEGAGLRDFFRERT